MDSEWEYESANCTDNNPTSNLPREAPSNELEAPILGYLDTDPPSEEDIPPPNSPNSLPDSETEEETVESDPSSEEDIPHSSQVTLDEFGDSYKSSHYENNNCSLVLKLFGLVLR